MSESDLRDWYGTELGLQEFVRSVKFFTSGNEYELLLRWASRREPHLSQAEIERIDGRAEVLAALLERWEPVGVGGGCGPVFEQVELKLG